MQPSCWEPRVVNVQAHPKLKHIKSWHFVFFMKNTGAHQYLEVARAVHEWNVTLVRVCWLTEQKVIDVSYNDS